MSLLGNTNHSDATATKSSIERRVSEIFVIVLYGDAIRLKRLMEKKGGKVPLIFVGLFRNGIPKPEKGSLVKGKTGIYLISSN